MEFVDSDLFSLFSTSQHSRLLNQGRWGLEREALRITPSGELALTPHPAAFGDKQDNPRITTDFSESQLEMITPPRGSIREAYRELEDVHREVRAGLANEQLWPLSMPGSLPDEREIPIARYASETGEAEAEIYRKGLALRYGKKMQMISGIHYNYSFAPELLHFLYQHSRNNTKRDYHEFVDALYFSVARNVLRYRWLLLYLFGASPVFDSSYDHKMLSEIDASELRNATSLRMSRVGYYNALQSSFSVSHNSKDEYIRDLEKILYTRSEQYAALGLYQNGERVQLNDCILQKASEFYSPLRFKQATQDNEAMLDALEKRGVAYLELRVLDLDPFSPTGVDMQTLYFTHTLMTYSLLADSPPLTSAELEECNSNHHRVALAGRKKGLRLKRKDQILGLKSWARDILHDLLNVASFLDGTGHAEYTQSVLLQLQKLNNPELLPSAVIEREMRTAGHHMTFYGLARSRSLHDALENMEKPHGATLSIDTAIPARLPVFASRFVNKQATITNMPAQCC